MDRRLFRPPGMTVEWASNFSDGRPHLSGGVYATGRDWARFGEFVRRTLDGSWSSPALACRALFDQVLASNVPHPA